MKLFSYCLTCKVFPTKINSYPSQPENNHENVFNKFTHSLFFRFEHE